MRVAQICCQPVQETLAVFPNLPLDAKREYDIAQALPNWDGLIIQATYPYDCSRYTDWGGLRLIKDLRTKFSCQLPILLTSWDANLISLTGYNAQLVGRPECCVFKDSLVRFVPLITLQNQTPATIQQLFDPPLTEEQQQNYQKILDILYNDPKALTREIFHQLRSGLGAQPGQPGARWQMVLQELQQIPTLFPDQEMEVFQLINLWKLLQSTRTDLYQSLRELYLELDTLLELSPQPGSTPSPSLQQQVLFIDDNPQDHQLLNEQLSPYGITCHYAATLEEARQMLREYPPISAILCDFRFYDRWGRIALQQGRDTLEYLKKQYSDIYFAHLSSFNLGRRDIDLITGVDFFFKEDILSGRPPHLPHLIRQLFQAAAHKQNATASVPEKLRRHPLGKAYQYYKEHCRTYQEWEEEIVQETDQYCRNYDDNILTARGFGHGALSHPNPKKMEEEEYFLKVKQKLLCRRVIIGLLQLPQESFAAQNQFNSHQAAQERRDRYEAIYDYLFGNYIKKDTTYQSKQTSLSNYLAIFTANLYQPENVKTPSLLFPEEWQWLRNR